MARRQAGHGGRRDLLAGCAQEASARCTRPTISHVVKAEKVGEREVKFTFDAPGNRELPTDRRRTHGAAEALVGRHRRAGPQARRLRDHAGEAAGLRPLPDQGIRRRPVGRAGAGQGLLGREPAGSVSGRTISTRCASNISATTIVALEAFKADQADWMRGEFSAKQWATAYDFPAVAEKRVIKEEFPISSSGRMQGFVFNLRRDQFKDARLRRALQLCVRLRGDEQAAVLRPVQAHQQLFRRHRAGGYRACRKGRSCEILETVRDKVPPEVFTTPYTNPVGGNPEAVRDNLREALRLLKEAGLRGARPQAGRCQTGKPFTRRDSDAGSVLRADHAVLQAVAGTARHHDVSVRMVDRRAIREPDCATWISTSITKSWGESLSPGNEQREFWGRKTADIAGFAQHCRHQESGGRQADRAA